MGKSKIEWTERTYNFLSGCNKVSPGCLYCYAERLFPRVYPGRRFIDLEVHEKRLLQPMSVKKASMFFVNSMSDTFHSDVPFEILDKAFAVMALSGRHKFQVLTKRHKRMQAYIGRLAKSIAPLEKAARDMGYTFNHEGISFLKWPIPNIWLGVSVENQRTANERVPVLLKTDAAIRFVSYEPALEYVDFHHLNFDREVEVDALNGTHGVIRPHGGKNNKIDWLIMGGESGSKARMMEPDWARTVKNQCLEAGTAFFMKQMTKKAEIPVDLMVRQYP